MTRSASHRPRCAAFAAALLLAGCSDGHDELRTWMEETRRATPLSRETISEPKAFEPFRYASAGSADPFSQSKLAIGLAQPQGRIGSTLQPDLQRRREPLEAYPLDNLKMVGNLRRGPTDVALLQAESLVYQVRVGNYVGQNFGRIVRISESEIALKELVQDAAGDWVERDTSLTLQTSQETKK